jgi:hypothetical protein
VGDAVAWQEECFGVNGMISCTDPEEYETRNRFSLIFVGSVFSHLPDQLFKAWMRKLYRLLRNDGVLAFSVHDVSLLPEGEMTDEKGIRYLSRSESLKLPTESYGLAYITEEYLRDVIDGATFGDEIQHASFKKALYENQDLHIVSRSSEIDLSSLRLKMTPLGGVDGRWVRDGQLVVTGWAIDLNEDEGIKDVGLFVNDSLASSGKLGENRPDVLVHFPSAPNPAVGWSVCVPMASLKAGDVVMCKIENQSGLQAMAHVCVAELL